MNNLLVERIEVWAAEIKDQPGSLDKVLSGLRDVGADLDFIIARRAPNKPGTGVVFVTPLRGDAEVAAAATLGFNVTNSIKSLRIEGENTPGAAQKVTAKLAAAGINLRGFSGAVIGPRFILFLGLDSTEDAQKAAAVLANP
ncbi:MAG: amino acid-binding protein [Deltaproteobacteria bacterium]|nr:amino acid-binding protein [Deltaproteobacteria bacterium]